MDVHNNQQQDDQFNVDVSDTIAYDSNFLKNTIQPNALPKPPKTSKTDYSKVKHFNDSELPGPDIDEDFAGILAKKNG